MLVNVWLNDDVKTKSHLYILKCILSYPKNSKKFKCVLFSSLVTKINKNKNKKPLILLNRIENWLKKKKKSKRKLESKRHKGDFCFVFNWHEGDTTLQSRLLLTHSIYCVH